MTPNDWVRVAFGFALAVLLAARGLKKKSLDQSGALAAFWVGFASFAAGYRFGKWPSLSNNSSFLFVFHSSDRENGYFLFFSVTKQNKKAFC